ncbi:threonine--tRNA ligase [Candidatus Kaiserbacteria bacterium]|nr:threonine--tRNA ligase [Candidatus Kaiserbacteria bacterium]
MSTLEHKRHTLAHLLAAAVVQHYPNAKLTLGPAIENGFYYDIDFGDETFSEDDLKRIQKTMKKTLSSWKEFTHEEVSPEQAREMYADNPFKLELIDDIVEKGEKITLYTAGDFTDLCRGGHVENPAEEISADTFKLDKVAGAYWRGDEKNPMLTRIYGLAFDTKEDLEAYEKQQEEAKKRDHRKLGKELDLFTFSDLVGPGLPLYTPKGQLMRESITDLLWNISKKYGYQKVSIPHITKVDLYETSGHAAKFKDEFFYVDGAQSGDKFVLKPMNCPHHTQIYDSKPRSYKELPIRMSEVTHMYRDEKPGQLVGLSRVRAITIDDAHIFCTPEHIKDEAINIVKIIEEFYTSFGLWNKGETFWVSLSVRDPEKPEDYLGEDENWNKAEQYLQEVSDELGLDAKRIEGEAAFYGPKLDFMFTDALGRERQLATIQLDFVMPERFGLEYVDKDGEKKIPVMIHRAIAGSLERFMVIMIEHFAGAFPLWLAPEQVRIVPVAEAHLPYAKEVLQKLSDADLRVTLDDSKESMGKKIRGAKKDKLPYFIVIGDKEVEEETVTLESRDDTSETYSLSDVVTLLTKERDERSL